jgi:indolepyruvate ferredoxin oxidoreductase alpha subunit
VGSPVPVPSTRALAFLEGLSEVLVFEELEPVIERELLQLVGAHRLPVKILGKLTGHTAQAGENSVAMIVEQVGAFLDIPAPLGPIDVTVDASGDATADATPGSDIGAPAAPAAPAPPAVPAPAVPAAPVAPTVLPPPTLPPRPPVLCAGCPHRASFYAVKRALRGRAAVFGGDIGCYTLGNALPLDMVDTCLCMGAGLTIPQGMDRVQPDVLHLGFVGDSTFFASGLTGVVNAVYNRSKVTLCILDNSTTAMTGSQPHPGTGIRMSPDAAYDTQKDAQRALRIPSILRALGVEQIAHVNPFELKTAIEAVRDAVAFEGPSALVFKAPCITVAPPKPQPTLSAATCTNCKRCIRELGCPALVLRAGKVAIDCTLCYGCGLCVGVCPTAAITPTPNGERDG